MMTIAATRELTRRIAAEGFDDETAALYAGSIAGRAWVEGGRVHVKNTEGETIAFLPVRVLLNPPDEP